MQNYILSETGWSAAGGDGLADLMPAEPCFLFVQSLEALERHESLVREAVARSRSAVLCAPARVASEPVFLERAAAFQGLFALSLRYRLGAPGEGRHAGAPPRGQEGDLRLVAHFRKLREQLSGTPLQLVPEIEIQGDLSLLGPTLMALAECRPPWIVLAVSGPPAPEQVGEIRHCFEYLKIRSFPFIDIHFSFENRHARSWAVQTQSPFCGPEEFHIDLSNRCTHSCVFCALYSPAVTADLKASGRFDGQLRSFMNAQLEEGKALSLIHGLPLGTKIVQFGGAGDPMLHPRVLELIAHLRERAITVEVLSNMEYLKESDLERLASLGGGSFTSLGGTSLPPLLFTVNLSAASPETYVRTRPRQTPGTFRKVLGNLRRLSELRARSGGRGARFRLMCVLNRLNYHEATRYVELAAEVGAFDVWFKPLEIHHPSHYELVIPGKEWPAFRREMTSALERAESLGMPVLDRKTLLRTLHSHTQERDENRAIKT